MFNFYHSINKIPIYVLLYTALLSACGGSPSRFEPGTPSAPAALNATAGDRQVSLTWVQTDDRTAAFDIHQGNSSGFTISEQNRIATVSSPSHIVTGLNNGTTYFFKVTAVSASGASGPSAEASATPLPAGPFSQPDLAGSWRFSILVSGNAAGWMRGSAVIAADGVVAITSFLDSTGSTTSPAGLFGTLTVSPLGEIRQDTFGAARFHGTLSADLNLVVATASPDAANRLLFVMQRKVPGVSFNANDIKGTGRTGTGPLFFTYHQLSSGNGGEWEWASGQVGQDQNIQYAERRAPSGPTTPLTTKVAGLAITADGMVTETPLSTFDLAAARYTPLPVAYMSGDKSLVVGTATDSIGPTPRYLLRILQIVHLPLNLTTYRLTDLTGSYTLHRLETGATPAWGFGSISMDSLGNGLFSSFLSSNGSTALQSFGTMSMDDSGVLSESVDPGYHGKLSYFKDMFAATRSEAAGIFSLSIALRSSTN